METLLVTIVQLMFVAIVYSAAYKSGYNEAHDRAVSTIREFSGPMSDLVHTLNDTLYKTGEAEVDDEDDPL